MDRARTLTILLILIAMLLAACAPKMGPGPAQQPSAPAPQVTAPSPAAAPLKPAIASAAARPAWQEKWESSVAAAKKEGRVSIATSGGTEMRTMFTRGIKDASGLEAEVVAGRGAEVTAKVLAERRAGLFLYDVYIGSTPVIARELKPNGVFEPIEAALILPEVNDPKVWYKGQFPWFEPDRISLAFSAFPGRPIAVNTNLVKPGDVKSWRDLLDPKWKGKLVLNDPTVSGSGQLHMLVLDLIMGWDYVRELAKAEPIIMRDQRQQLDWLAHGKIAILIAPKPDTFAEFVKVGAPVAIVEPEEGSSLNCSTGAISLFKNAPHPGAATVYLNWFLTKEGQTLFANAVLQQSARLDVPTTGLPPDLVRKSGVKYVPVYDEPALARRDVTDKLGKELFGPLIKSLSNNLELSLRLCLYFLQRC